MSYKFELWLREMLTISNLKPINLIWGLIGLGLIEGLNLAITVHELWNGLLPAVITLKIPLNQQSTCSYYHSINNKLEQAM